jgi:nitrile hydratase accessory protein
MKAVDLDLLEGASALPRSNGELVFEQPWHGSAFGLAVALAEQGVIDWEEFRAELVRHIAVATDEGQAEYSYYACWMAALQDLLAQKSLIDPAAVMQLASHIIATELEHDDHDHASDEHDHHH